MSADGAERPLSGGRSRAGVVRVGQTVRRPTTARSWYVHAVLRRLAEHDVAGVPRLLGVDAHHREILTFLPGETGHGLRDPDPDLLQALGAWTARFHDALAGTPEAGSAETVCHRDLAPWNLVLGDRAPDGGPDVGFIDVDDAAPGERAADVGYLLWTFLDLGSDGRHDDRQHADIRLVVDAYTATSRDRRDLGPRLAAATLGEVDRILAFRRSQLRDDDPATASFAADRVAEIEATRAWLADHRMIFVR